jgi:hypothetical protein
VKNQEFHPEMLKIFYYKKYLQSVFFEYLIKKRYAREVYRADNWIDTSLPKIGIIDNHFYAQ